MAELNRTGRTMASRATSTIIERLAERGYRYTPSPLQVATFHAAVLVGNLVFTSGQIPDLDNVRIKGRVGDDIDVASAQKAAEICAFNCVRAAGAVVDVLRLRRVVKVLGVVNAAEGFEQMSEVINGCSMFYDELFPESRGHARSAIGGRLPANWAVEVETIFLVGH